MQILYFVSGLLLGIIITSITISINNHKTHGIIEVDHASGQCIVRITSDEVADIKNKKSVFNINHNAVISREEQSL